MPLEYSEFLIFLLIIVLVAVIIFAFTMGTLVRGNHKSKPQEKVEAKKPKPVKPPSKSVVPNPCLLFQKTGTGYVGYLRREWKKAGEDQPYPPCCFPDCLDFLKCVGVEK